MSTTATATPTSTILSPTSRTAAGVALRHADVRLPSGVRLHYVEAGDPSAAPIILLHGVTDSWFSFSRVLPALARQGRVIAVDQRGHGRSDRPASRYGYPDLARDVVELMDALGIPQAAIVGHSMGSFVAQHVAATAPARVTRLVLVGSGADVRVDPVRELNATLATLPDPIPEEFVREFQLSTMHLAVPPAFLDTVVAESRSVPARVWRDLFAAMVVPEAVAPLARIGAPTLILSGAQDAIFSIADQDALRAALPTAEFLRYDDTGHAPHWERPEQFARDVVAFLGKQ